MVIPLIKRFVGYFPHNKWKRLPNLVNGQSCSSVADMNQHRQSIPHSTDCKKRVKCAFCHMNNLHFNRPFIRSVSNCLISLLACIDTTENNFFSLFNKVFQVSKERGRERALPWLNMLPKFVWHLRQAMKASDAVVLLRYEKLQLSQICSLAAGNKQLYSLQPLCTRQMMHAPATGNHAE